MSVARITCPTSTGTPRSQTRACTRHGPNFGKNGKFPFSPRASGSVLYLRTPVGTEFGSVFLIGWLATGIGRGRDKVNFISSRRSPSHKGKEGNCKFCNLH